MIMIISLEGANQPNTEGKQDRGQEPEGEWDKGENQPESEQARGWKSQRANKPGGKSGKGAKKPDAL